MGSNIAPVAGGLSILMPGVWYGCMFATSTALAISDHAAVAGYIQGASRSHLRVGRGVECGYGIRRSACCGNTNMAPANAVAIKGMFLKLHSFSTLILLQFPPQVMAAHKSPRTTKLYDRTKERLTQDDDRGAGAKAGGRNHQSILIIAWRI